MLRSRYLASAAIAAVLALPAAAQAQQATAPAATTAPHAPAEASPLSSHSVPGSNVEQRVEEHIRELHAQLRITPAEQPQWDQFANVMRDNARDMNQQFTARREQFSTMNALQNMQSYEKIADAHAQHLQQLVPAFENLYNAMPESQKRLADQVFRENAEAHAQRHVQTERRVQTGSNAVR
jgi:periplasmic protein CpxP/Spy